MSGIDEFAAARYPVCTVHTREVVHRAPTRRPDSNYSLSMQVQKKK